MIGPVRLVHDVYGDHGPVVVLVHGLGSMGAWWPPPLIERLAAAHVVVVPDLRDSGRSPTMDHLAAAQQPLAAHLAASPPAPPYTLGDMAADVVLLLDDLEVERAHVVGASMGGMVAQHIAIDAPSRVASLTSIMSTTGASDLPSGDPEVLASLQDSSPAVDEESFVTASVETARRTSRSPLFDEADAVRRYRDYWRIGADPAGSTRHILAVIADGDRTGRLAAVQTPTLVVHGSLDPMVPVEGGRATARAVAGATYLELEDVGHELPAAVHGEVARAISDHVAGAPPRTAADAVTTT